ncbi:MAG: thiamine-binding protein [Firmicutes bacterium]|nr:thiamine-binding protein [Bacillota bacterium]MBQ6842538.1 thiamine-binding protein [Bacillota bacterium]
MKASIAIQSLPTAENETEMLRIVDAVIAYIQSTGLHYVVTPFETVIEGDDLDQLLDIAKECQHIAIREGATKLACYMKLWYQADDKLLTIEQKTAKFA